MEAGRHFRGIGSAFSGRGFPLLEVLLWLVVLGSVTPVQAALEDDASRSLVQAGFTTKFPLFVSWPEEAWAPGVAPLSVCVIGETPVLADLQQLAHYTDIEGSSLEIQRTDDPGTVTGCQIVFIAGGEADRLEEILDALRGKPILTVADSPGFAKRGVHINFFVENEKVRFELNQRACEASGLGLSFRLRNVAKLVE